MKNHVFKCQFEYNVKEGSKKSCSFVLFMTNEICIVCLQALRKRHQINSCPPLQNNVNFNISIRVFSPIIQLETDFLQNFFKVVKYIKKDSSHQL